MRNCRSEDLRVFPCGLIINPKVPFLGTTPDSKVLEPGCSMPYGLVEIKCPYANNTLSLDDKCADKRFYMRKLNEEYHLDVSKPQGKQYYEQIQGQLALSGLPWCDFVVYLAGSQEMAVERIYYDKKYWDEHMLPYLGRFYYKHAIKFLGTSYM